MNRHILIALAGLMIATGQNLVAARELLTSFGNIEISQIPENKSFELRMWTNPPYPASFGLQCHTTARAFFVYLDPNALVAKRVKNPQTFTIWSDRSQPIDLVLPTSNGGAIAADTEGIDDSSRDAARKIVEILGQGQKFFAFSTAGSTARFDLIDLPAARARFSELCAIKF